jgi:glycosyltransferase involved in cell wall biosynthesis
MPTVSIIVPCYNQAAYVAACLDSVLKQTFTDWECIIINDGSLDNTDEIVKTYLEKDTRLQYINNKNAGVSNARNCGIKKATGTFILPLDADDIIHEAYLYKAVEKFKETPAIALLYCKADYFGEINEPWKLPPYSYKRLLRENLIFCSAFFYREQAIAVGLFDETLAVGLEDWEFFLRLINEDSIVYELSETLFFYRIKKQSRSVDVNTSKKATQEVREKVYAQRPDMYYKYFGDVVSIIQENETQKEKIAQFKTFKPNRTFKNLIKFFKKEQMFIFE